MIPDGTTRICNGSTEANPHDVKYTAKLGWHHTDRSHWTANPHKASPKRYVQP